MKSDIKGVSQCKPGQENFETFDYGKKEYITYDYRTESGKLFSCIAPTVEKCRVKRDRWAQEEGVNANE